VFGKAKVDPLLAEHLTRDGVAQRESAFSNSPERQVWIDGMLDKRRTPYNDLWDAWH
jgi:hypothetical protein